MQEQDQLHLPESLKEALEMAKQAPADGELHLQKARTWQQVVTRREKSRLRGRLVPFAVALVAVAALIGYLPNAGLFGGEDADGKNAASALKPVQQQDESVLSQFANVGDARVVYDDPSEGYKLVQVAQTMVLVDKDGKSTTDLFKLGEYDHVQLMSEKPPHFVFDMEKPDRSNVVYMVDAHKKSAMTLISKEGASVVDFWETDTRLVVSMIDPSTLKQKILAFDLDNESAGNVLYESQDSHTQFNLSVFGDLLVLSSDRSIVIKKGAKGEWKTIATGDGNSPLQLIGGSSSEVAYITGSVFQPGPDNEYKGTARVMRYDVKRGVSEMLLPNWEGDQTLISSSGVATDFASRVGYVIGNFVPKKPLVQAGDQAGTMEVWYIKPGKVSRKLFEYDTTWSKQALQISAVDDTRYIFMRTKIMTGEPPADNWVWDSVTGTVTRDKQVIR